MGHTRGVDVSHLANIPSPPQGVWYLGPVPIRAYALCIIVGIVVAAWLTAKRYAARGGDPEVIWDTVIVAVPCGIIGGRAYHVITHYEDYFGPGHEWWEPFDITSGGLAIMGAVALGGLGVFVMFRIRGIRLGPLADALAPGLVLAQAIGRLGNWFNQELYGRPTDVPWALDIYYRVDEAGNFAPMTGRSTGEVIASVHPTFLYEMIWNIGVAVALLLIDRRLRVGHGRLFALYVALYGSGRFVIEHMRTDEAYTLGPLRLNGLVAALLVVGAIVVFFLLRSGRETPPQVAASKKNPTGELTEQALAAVLAAGRDPKTGEPAAPTGNGAAAGAGDRPAP